MTLFDWIKLLVPLIGNLLISSFVAVYIKSAIDRSFKQQEKKNQYMAVVLSNLNDYFLKLKKLIVYLQSGLSENAKDDISSLFIIGGGIQSYCENYQTFFEQINRKEHKEVFAISDHKRLLDQFNIAGNVMNSSPFDFGHTVEEIRKICTQLIQHYNSVMLNY